jgi:hypothetical protein
VVGFKLLPTNCQNHPLRQSFSSNFSGNIGNLFEFDERSTFIGIDGWANPISGGSDVTFPEKTSLLDSPPHDFVAMSYTLGMSLSHAGSHRQVFVFKCAEVNVSP